MSVVLIAALHASTSTAQAADFQSEPQSVVFEGGNTILTRQYELPLLLDVGFILESIGFVATATADSTLMLRMEGESQIQWPDPNGEGYVQHQITPLPSGSDLALDTTVSVALDFVVDVDLIFTNPGPLHFVLFSRSIPFRPNIRGFEPFLLPGQQTTSLRITADATNGDIRLPFNFSLLDLGVIGVSVGIVIEALPITYSIISGNELITQHESDQYNVTDPLFPTSLALYENNGKVDLETRYSVNTDTVVGYRFTGDGGFTVEILGQPIDFYINLFDFTVNLFTGSETAEWSSGPYSHPIPTVDLPVPNVDFGTIPVGEQRTFTVPINNDGELALDAVVSIEGDAVFSGAPMQLFAAPGGQDAIVVTFAPTEAGQFNGTLRMRTSDPLEPMVDIPLAGIAERKVEDDGGNGNEDDNLYGEPGSTTLYTGCGCATGSSPTWTVLLAAAWFGARRRRA
jgi:MYXO-CTERM domain-containing protein